MSASKAEAGGRVLAKRIRDAFIPRKKYATEFYEDLVNYGYTTAIYNQGWLYGHDCAARPGHKK